MCFMFLDNFAMQKGYSVTMKDNFAILFDKNQMLFLKTPLAENRTSQTNMKNAELKCLFSIVNIEDIRIWNYIKILGRSNEDCIIYTE